MEKVLLQSFPARDWREATPLGNGRLGALVHGRASDERVALNHEALYNWARRGDMPDLSPHLPELRRLLADGRFAEAERLYPDLLKASGYKGSSGKFFPAFDLRLRCLTDGAFRDYSRELDLERGVCTVRWTDDGGAWERTAFVHCAAGAGGPLVLRVRRTGTPFSVSLSLPQHDLIDYPGYGGWDSFSTEARGRAVLSTVKTPDGLHFCGMARLLATDGAVGGASPPGEPPDPSGGSAGTPRPTCSATALVVDDATFVDLVVDVDDEPRSFEAFEEKLARFDGESFGSLLAAHAAAFLQRFGATRICLVPEDAPQETNERLLLDSYSGNVDPRLVEKMADFGRYLLLSSSGFGCSRPANLQGVWNGDYAPAWGATYFLDENVAMTYWQALAGGMPETLLPLFDLLDRFKGDFRTNARRLWGCRGLLLPVFMGDRSGLKDNFQPHCVYWTGAGAWIAAFFWDYWLWTNDRAFLRDRAWPFLREVALFYEDFLVPGADGFLHASPAISPENKPTVGGKAKHGVSADPTMEIALVREVLSHALAAAAELGVDDAQTAHWREMLGRLPPYRTRPDGALCEWIDPRFGDNDRHRHLSHLYPLFPGREIAPHRDPALFEAARLAAEARLATGLPDQTGWSLAHLACVWARLGEGDRALGCLELLLRCCTGPNLFTRHNDWRGMGVTLEMLHGTAPPVQLDAAFGFRAAVQEMLLRADGETLFLLPALPRAWTGGRAENLRAPGGLSVSLEWDEAGLRATIALDSAAAPAERDVYLPGEASPRRIAVDPGSRTTVSAAERKTTVSSST
jgi:alpha-L-fucosidase 2